MAKSGITAKQSKAIRLLISGVSALQVAKTIGVHENTVYAWNKEPYFQEALKSAENEAMKGVTRALLNLAKKATGTLESVMDNATGQDSSKNRAADIVLGRLYQSRELVDIEERISKLEDVIK